MGRLKEIKERYEKNKLQTLPLTNEQCKWLINRVEELEGLLEKADKHSVRNGKEIMILTDEKAELEFKNQRYKQALEEILNADCDLEGLDAERELDRVTDIALKALEGEE